MSNISVRAVDPAAPTSTEMERARQEFLIARGQNRELQAEPPLSPRTEASPPVVSRSNQPEVPPRPFPPEIHQGQILSKIA